MPKKQRSTRESVLAVFRKVHGDKYQYPAIPEFPKDELFIDIFCPLHGTFRQAIHYHKRGQGCPKCGVEKKRELYRLGRDEWIRRFESVHGRGKYDYSKVPESVTMQEKVEIYCPEHNYTFWQSPDTHWRFGKGCRICAVKKRKETRLLQLTTRREFEKKARAIHGTKYEYTELPHEFSLNDNIIIYCNEHDHVFFCVAKDHLYGKECPLS
jgi:hypothetical protein